MEGLGSQGLKTKLIINYLPQKMSDEQFEMLFSQIGPLNSAKVMRERDTGYSFGYGFIDYVSPNDAVNAISTLNGYKIEHKTLKVAFSKPPSEKNTNLFINGLGPQMTEEKLLMLFSNHGEVVNTKVLREKSGMSKGSGFVLFKTSNEADEGTRALQGYVDGSGSHFQIKIAQETNQQQKSHPKYKEYLRSSIGSPQQSYISDVSQDHYGTNQDSYKSNMRNDDYGSRSSYSYVSADQVLPQQNQRQLPSYVPSYGGGYATTSAYGVSDARQRASRGRGVSGNARYNPLARPTSNFSDSMTAQEQVDQDPTVLFVYNIGPKATQGDMYAMFAKYGRIERVDVMEGRGFAFIHMPIAKEAQEAMRCLNGLQYEGKNLQVSIKK